MKLMMILSRVPYPLDKGDKLRAFNQLKELSRKHQIILVALNDKPLDPAALAELQKYCRSISIIPFSKITVYMNLVRGLFTGRPLQVEYFLFARARKKVDELIRKHQPLHIYCQLIRTADYAMRYPGIPKTLDYMDAFSKGIEKRKTTAPFYMKPLLWMEHRRLMRYERKVFGAFNNKTIISSQDRDYIPHPEKNRIVIVPNGVDTDFFKPMAAVKDIDVLFNGNMNYPPNVEAAEFLVQKVMPLVWSRMPNVKVLISGASPGPRVLDLASSNVTVSGWVDDIRQNFARSRMLVAPMQISIGLQNKILEAMAMQLPCITTTTANNAVQAKHNDEIIVADEAGSIATAIFQLLNDRPLADRIGMNGYRFVLQRYTWTGTTAILQKLISS